MDMMQKVSVPGTYHGYSIPVADGYVRDSRYITLKDGCRIAYDTYLPTASGKVRDGALPTVIVATGYRRAWAFSKFDAAQHVVRRFPHLKEGNVATYVNQSSHLPDGRHSQWLESAPAGVGQPLADWVRLNGSAAEYLLVYGYAFVVIDVRGTGASFGTNYADGWQTGKDLAEIYDFLVTEPWCDGNLGMIGCSWHGGTQYFTINYGTPHLKAAIPQMASYDVYYGWYPGGAYLSGFLRQWSKRRESEDRKHAALPVFEDTDGEKLAEALEERKQVEYPTDEDLDEGHNAPEMPLMARDEMLESFPIKNRELADGSLIDLEYQALDFKRAALTDTAVYLFAGWFDIFPRDVITAYWNLRAPKKLIIGPWHHNNYWDRDESLRWFDYWLRGIDNGVTDEAPFTYSTQDSSGRAFEWSGTDEWPLPAAEHREWYFSSCPGSEGYSINDGSLATSPEPHAKCAELPVDYSASAGRRTRVWYHGGPHLDYSPLDENNRKGLTWTSKPLESDIEIAGAPYLNVYLSSNTEKGIIVAYLEEIDANGGGELVSEVVLNLEFRDIQDNPPLEMKDLAYRSYHSSTRRAVVPGEVMELQLDMLPVSCVLKKGRRLRLSLHGADCDNFFTVQSDPPPEYRILMDDEHRSRLNLPIIPQNEEREALRIHEAMENCPDKCLYAVKKGG